MRRQMKIAAVVSATALLAIGASFTSMAAAKTGTWKLEEEGWVCYDKDGDVYENEFCLDGGKEFYVGDDGILVTNEWVDDAEGNWYYVGSTGAKTIYDWKQVIPEGGDEEDDAEWFYFGSKGKKTTGKKVIDGKTYYFNNEGILLTGWINYDGEEAEAIDAPVAAMSSAIVYADETGARVASSWVNTYAPGTDEDEIEEGDADKFWYYIKSKGAAQTGRNLDINGQTYYFGVDGKMLSGWVVGTDGDDADTKDDTFFMTTDSNAFALGNVYFCGDENQGWSKKNTWVKTWAPDKFEDADNDNDQYWYWIGKDGVVFAAGETASAANGMKFVDGEDREVVIDSSNQIATKEISNKTYAFKANGQMWSGLVKKVESGEMFYFGGKNDGSMKTGTVMIADNDDYEYKFYFGENDKNDYVKGVAVTGNAGGDLYINGQLVTSDEKYEVIPVGGVNYLIDSDGDIRTSKKVYKDEDGNVVLDATVAGFDFSDVKGTLNGSF